MEKKKILATASHTGGANAIIPVIKELQKDPNLEIVALGDDISTPVFNSAGIHCHSINEYMKGPIQNQPSVSHIVQVEDPHLVLSGTGFQQDNEEQPTIDQAVRLAASESAIHVPTLAVLDSWFEEQWRFIDRRNPEKVLPYSADLTTALDDYSKERVIKLSGLPRDKVIITGNPHFQSFQEFGSDFTEEQNAEVRKQLDVPKDAYLILQATDTQKDLDSNKWGFTNADITDTICRGLYKEMKDVFLYIRRHPREKNDEAFKQAVEVAKKAGVNYVTTPFKNGKLVTAASDMIVGAASTVMIEGLLMGKAVLGLQPCRQGEDEFVLHQREYTPFAYSKIEGARMVNDMLECGPIFDLANKRRINFEQSSIANGGAIRRVKDLAYAMLAPGVDD